MTSSAHIVGGVLGGLLGVVFVGVARHYAFSSIDPTEATAVGIAAVGAGATVMHAVWNIGIGPIISRVLHGPEKPAPVPLPPV